MSRVLASEVVAAAASLEGLTVDALLTGQDRAKVLVRHRAMFVIRQLRPELSLVRISRHLGRADHTTALNGVRQVESRIAVDPDEAAKVSTLMSIVQSGVVGHLIQRQTELKAELAAVERRLTDLQYFEHRGRS